MVKEMYSKEQLQINRQKKYFVRRGGIMPNNEKQLLHKYCEEIKSISEDIKKVILYGSYARGDNREDSDIDVMILVDLKGRSLKEFEDKIFDVTYDFNEKYDLFIMPVVQDMKHFDRWKNAYMFYYNVDKEGVTI